MSGVRRRIAAGAALGSLIVPFFWAAPTGVLAAGAPTAVAEAVCAPATPGTAECLALRMAPSGALPGAAIPALNTPQGFGPADLQSAYALPSGSAGAGLTVAVVDAFDLPTAEADLAAYRAHYGLPACTTANRCFHKMNQSGSAGPLPVADSNWGVEIALDIEMVSAACPKCNILLVEAWSATFADLGTAVNTAVSMGAVAVSNSYGGPEWSSETSLDTYYNHPGVAITVSTGDCGWNCSSSSSAPAHSVEYPAASPYVISVGGTQLARDGSARGWTESAWGHGNGGAGSGCSLYEPKPAWQLDTGCPNRTEADVSAVADPSTGVAVYVSGSWYPYTTGGTSVASPIIAATFALAGWPAPATYPASYLYARAGSLNDITGGNSDVTWHNCPAGSYLCNGVAGYDGPTGLGTPNGIAAFKPPPHSTYHPLTPPVRLLDTRSGNGLGGKLLANTPATFGVAGRAGSGIPTNASAVTGNVTVVSPSNSWAVYLGPNPLANPGTSTINFGAGQTTGNGLTVALGPGGTLSATYISTAGNTTDLVFDVTGFFTPDTGGATYHAISPSRLLDTRSGNGLGGKLLANTPATFGVAGRAGSGIPSYAIAVTGNVTVVNPTNSWAVYLGPDPSASPGTSTINFNGGEVKGNSLTVALGSGGTLSATYMSSGGNTTDLVFDVTGYYTADSSGASFVPITPARLLDTRFGNGLGGKLLANTPATFGVGGRGVIPANAAAVTGNVTVVNETSSWAVFLGPDPTPSPGTSTINFNAGDVKGNGLTVALGSGGTLSATYMSNSGNTTDLVFDVTGYYVP